jgi:hypothetical protein
VNDPIPVSDAAPEVITAPQAPMLGARIAGGLLLLNAAVMALELVLMPNKVPNATSSLVPAVVDVLIGASLLRGDKKYLQWAIVRAVGGAVIWTGLSLANGEHFVAALQVLVSASLLALLIGQPGRARIAAACLAFSLYGLVELAGLLSLTTGVNPIAATTMQLSGELEPESAGTIHGVAFDYALTAPAKSWHLYKAEVMHKNNPLADRWLVRPDVDAHLLVIAERLEPGMTLELKNLSKVIVDNARKAITDIVVLEDAPMPTRDGWLLRFTGASEGKGIEFYVGLYAKGRNVVQVQGFAPNKSFAAAKPELERAVASLELPAE